MLKGRKVCTVCKKRKNSKSFHLRGDHRPEQRQAVCKDCTKKNKVLWDNKNKTHIKHYNQNRRIEYNKKLLQYLSDKRCIDCGENDPIVLEFDHISNKTSGVSALISGRWSWGNILKEIEKYEIRCANCHRKKTAKQRQTVKLKLIRENYASKRV